MKPAPLILLASLLLLATSALPTAQGRREGPGGPDDRARPGGSGWRGPGDTAPSGGANSGGPRVNPGAQPGPNRGGPGLAATPVAPLPSSPPHPLLADPTEPPPVETPAGRPETDDGTSWQIWWHYNRWNHLDVSGRMELAVSGADSFFLGRGQRLEEHDAAEVNTDDLQNLVVPALSAILDLDSTSELEIHALHALAKVRGLPRKDGTEDFLEIVRRSLVSPSRDVAEKAVLALGIRGDASYFEWLDRVLNERENLEEVLGRTSTGLSVRVFAAYGLGLLAERSADKPELRFAIQASLSEALRAASRPELQAACLMAMGLNPLPVDPRTGDVRGLEDLPTTSTRSRADQVLEVLAFFEDGTHAPVARSQAPNALVRLLAGTDDALRGRVLEALLAAVSPHTREQREVQNGAVIALGALGTSGSAELEVGVRSELARIAYRSSADRLTRYLAMVGLGEASSRPGAGDDPYAGIEEARRTMLRQLELGRGESLAWTALGLGLLEEHAATRGSVPDPTVARALREAFEQNRSAQTSGALAVALGLLRDPEAHAVLRERLADTGETHVRGYVALALGMSGAHTAKDDLVRLLSETLNEPFALQQVALSLALLGAADTAPRLTELFFAAASPRARASLASAIGWIGDPRPLSALVEVLHDDRASAHSKAWASVAIGRIADDDPWPWVGRLSVGINYDVELPQLIEAHFQTGLLDLP